MRITVLTFLFSILSFSTFLYAGGKDNDTTTILIVDGQPVSVQEFNYIYSKNNQRNERAYTEKDLKDYVKLFINFKLKVLEAERLGLDTNKEFIQELNGYKKQLAKPYLTEDSVITALTAQAYERLKTEIKASHLLILVKENASPEDTLKAYKKILAIKKRIDQGEDFETLAYQLSEDPSAKMNNGDLGYFRALNMVYPFEEAAYTTPVGKVSAPIRTSFGYHLIYVADKRPSQGTVTAAHIMINAKNGIPEEDSLAAKRKIDEIYTKLTADPSQWNALCTQFSDHEASKKNNGELRPFETGNPNLPADFKEKVFALDKEGAFTKPFKTAYGWHIAKLLKREPLKSFEEVSYELKNKVMRDQRSALSEEILIKKLKKENNVVESKKGLETLLSYADERLKSGSWDYKATDKLNVLLFSIGDEKYNVGDALFYIKAIQRPSKDATPSQLMTLWYNQFLNKSILTYEEDHLEEKYDDYRLLVKEYRDGILLFELMDEKVWSRAVKDTSGLKKFYEAHKEDYMWDKRVKATVYDLENQKLLKKLKKDIKKGKTNNELLEKYNEDSPLVLQIKSDTYEKGDNEQIDSVQWVKGEQVIESGERIYYIVVEEVLEPTPKAFNEARGLIISDYQSTLESNWLEELRKRYPVEVKESVLEGLAK